MLILSAARTPIGSFQGALAATTAPRLGAVAVRAAVEQAGLQPADITDVVMGQVLQAGSGQAPARQAALFAGLPHATRAVTVNKVCGSGLQAVIDAVSALRSDPTRIYVAGGMEHMSSVPYLLPGARAGTRLGHHPVVDSLIADGLWDPYSNSHMGSCAEACAAAYGFSRQAQEAYAMASFERAIEAQRAGAFNGEIASVEIAGPKGAVTRVERDEGPGRANFAKMADLKPAFDTAGTITAATASTLNDGSAALVLCSETSARAAGRNPIARIAAFGAHAQDPSWFTTAPVKAARNALDSAGWSASDVDLWEVNEAFAVVPMAFMQELGLSHEVVNVRGGAIALGHPIGCSGARILVTLIAALRARHLNRGVAAICIGGGEGLAACVELI